jgi:hypothetical protein
MSIMVDKGDKKSDVDSTIYLYLENDAKTNLLVFGCKFSFEGKCLWLQLQKVVLSTFLIKVARKSL